ncbi:DUF3560 domain-containing protein [Glutamicibacter sp. NPDC090743]|uniref:DUF3560 domain-containing protein n=1 Tax=Glutamicibacter sp. NPDC090743 TaxID=3364001 RepID=UPI00380A78C9
MNLNITHTSAEGTIIEGTERGDGSAPILKQYRWRWSRYLGAWYIPRSRDTAPKHHIINPTAKALTEAGFTIEISIDDTPRPTAEVEADLAQRATNRAEALDAKAERKAQLAEQAESARRAAHDRLPEFGEPIKVGHHSENRHRRDIDRAHSAMGRSVEADRAAEHAAQRAKTAHASTGARNSPTTVSNRIDKLQAEQRATQRRLDGYTAHPGSPYAEQIPPATGDYRERLLKASEHLAEQIQYWQQIRTEQIANGKATNYTQQDIQPGDLIKVGSSWWTVRRANAKTVTVESLGCSTRAPYGTITDHKSATSTTE